MTGFMIFVVYLGIGLFFNMFVVLWIIRKAYKKYDEYEDMDELLKKEFSKENYILIYVQLLWFLAVPVIIGQLIFNFLSYIFRNTPNYLTVVLLKIHKYNHPEEYV